MRIGDALRLSPEESSDPFYAASLKDAGCSANAERVYQMFGGPDEHETKRAVWLRDWRKLDQKVRYALEWVEPEGDFLAVPNAILDKPGKLTPPEWAIVKQHPAHTLNVLRRVPIFDELAEDAANHHERLDGRGYFRGLGALQLTTTARILAVADVADALMSARPDREAMPIEQVLALVQEGRDTQFCPDCVDALNVSLASAAA